VCEPLAAAGQRISEMRLDDGTPIEAGRNYKVAGWATVGSVAEGPPIWDVVAEYLRDAKVARVGTLNTPVLKGVGANQGLTDYPGSS